MSKPQIAELLAQYEQARHNLIMAMVLDPERWDESLSAICAGYPEFVASLTEPLKTLP